MLPLTPVQSYYLWQGCTDVSD